MGLKFVMQGTGMSRQRKTLDWYKVAKVFVIVLMLNSLGLGNSIASDVITIPLDVDAVDISESITWRPNYGTLFKVSTAPDDENIIRRIEVNSENGVNDDWAVFALMNPTEQPLERLLVVPHYRLVNSGVFRPDLGSERIVKISASEGLPPMKSNNLDADVFLISIGPGEIITYVAELTTPDLPQIYLWQPRAYAEYANSYVLYQGIMLGIASLLALFLSIIVVVKGTILFPATAILAWAVFIYLCVDFGFWNRLFGLTPGGESLSRALSETLLAGSFLLFNFVYLNLRKWRLGPRLVGLLVIIATLFVIGIALADPTTGSGIARVSLAVTGILGMTVIVVLVLKKYERAILLLPTWILLVFWITVATVAVTGQLDNEMVQPALNGGLVMIVLLIGFSVMQHAFSNGVESLGAIPDENRRALAVIGSGDIIWEWNVAQDKMYADAGMEEILRLRPGSLHCSRKDWINIIHPEERQQFQSILDAVITQKLGRVIQTFRFREENGHYRSFLLKARSVLGPDAEVVLCIGCLQDVTDFKLMEERLLHDAIFDSLTGLPNQFLFIDRLRNALNLTLFDGLNRPAVLMFCLDEFDEFVQIHGVSAGNSILLSIAQKLGRLIKTQDGLSRLSGDKFAIMLESVNSMAQVKEFAEILQKSLNSPIEFGETTAKFTCSIGIAVADDKQSSAEDLLYNSELAMKHAKNVDFDSVMVFQSKMRNAAKFPNPTGDDLKNAMNNHELTVFYQPIVNLQRRLLAGFEATIRWRHPTHGQLSEGEIFPLAEQTNLIGEIGKFLLERTSQKLAIWQKRSSAEEPLFICLSLKNRRFMSYDLVNEVKCVLTEYACSPRSLKIDLNESLIMHSPEFAVNLLERLRSAGAGLSLDGFGRGQSSLNYLQSFPFDLLKFDRYSAHSSSSRGNRLLVIKNIVKLANDLGMDVMAVGVSSEKDVSELSNIDCNFAQGNLFGQPMTESEADVMIKRNKT